jgi:hypothetical protein
MVVAKHVDGALVPESSRKMAGRVGLVLGNNLQFVSPQNLPLVHAVD